MNPCGDKTKITCSLCKYKHFSVGSGGLEDVKRHAKGRMGLVKYRRSPRMLTGMSSNVKVGLSESDEVSKPEIPQTLKVVEANMSFSSAKGDAKRF